MAGETREWCSFLEVGTSASGKTKRWWVEGSGGEGDILGTVRWHAPWRQYIFEPRTLWLLLLSPSCLRQIADFCENETRARRAVGARNAEENT